MTVGLFVKRRPEACVAIVIPTACAVAERLYVTVNVNVAGFGLKFVGVPPVMRPLVARERFGAPVSDPVGVHVYGGVPPVATRFTPTELGPYCEAPIIAFGRALAMNALTTLGAAGSLQPMTVKAVLGITVEMRWYA